MAVISTEQVTRHLDKASKGHKGSIKFLINNRQEILNKVYHQLDITLEQTLQTIWISPTADEDMIGASQHCPAAAL